MTKRLRADSPESVAEAARLLLDGKLVAIPTETVYGLAALGLDPAAVRRIFEAKGRPADNPLILHVPNIAAAEPLWDASPEALTRAHALTAIHWPGPLTVVLPASDLVPPIVRAGLPKVAVRVPAHPSTLRLLELVGQPLAAPSANLSGRPSPTRADDVLATLDGRIAAVLDGGVTNVGLESTVIDVTEPEAVVLRPGMIDQEILRRTLANITVRPPGSAAHVASPGVRHRHYAPAIQHVILVSPEWLALGLQDTDAVLVSEGHLGRLPRTPAVLETLPSDPEGYARGLYAALYRLERSEPARLVIVEPDGASLRWTAVRDRLLRAADDKL